MDNTKLAFDAPSLKLLKNPDRFLAALILLGIGALMGWPLGTGGAEASGLGTDKIGIIANQMSAICGAVSALWYAMAAPWRSENKHWLQKMNQLFGAPVVVATITTLIVAGLLGMGLFSLTTMLISLVMLVTPLPYIYLPAIAFAPLCALICRWLLKEIQKAAEGKDPASTVVRANTTDSASAGTSDETEKRETIEKTQH